MPSPDQFDGTGAVTIRLDFDVGRTSVRMARYELRGGDAMAMAGVIDRVIKQILADWPTTAFSGEISWLARVALCESART